MHYPDQMNAAFYLVDENARLRPDRVAIYYNDIKITYGDLADKVNRFGNALKGLGVGKGDRFVCRMPNRPEAAVVFLAGLKIGAVPIPSFPFLREPELEHVINFSDAVGLVSCAPSLDAVKDIRRKAGTLGFIISVGDHESADATYDALVDSASCLLEAAPTRKDDLAFLCFSSGTTGRPKGLPHKHESCLITADITIPHGLGGLKKGDVLFTTSPFGFSFGLCTLIFYPFRFGSSVVYADAKLEAEHVFQVIEKYRVTHLSTVGTMYQKMLEVPGAGEKYDLRDLRILKGGAMEIPVQLQKRWKSKFGHDILPGFGMQEIIGSVISCTSTKLRYGSIGETQPGCQARVLDDNDRPLPAGQKGRLSIKVPCVIPYYWKDAQLTGEYLSEDGWFKTDDIVYRDPDGFFYYVGRSDNVIVSAGWTIAPAEIENILTTHPVISEAAVVSVSDAGKGKIPVAAVVLKKGVKAAESLTAEIQKFVRERLVSYKCPREIYYVESLPKTPTGKVKIKEVQQVVDQNRALAPDGREFTAMSEISG
ncbi:MAG: class I adenylate-forming enzyme family protein [Desulfobacterales bacterium]|nr:class I adenylate-forming enzyme family protein [Desulfobacterales bacterium]